MRNNYKGKEISNINELRVGDVFWFKEDGGEVWYNDEKKLIKAICIELLEGKQLRTGEQLIIRFDVFSFQNNKWLFEFRHSGYRVNRINPQIIKEVKIKNYPKQPLK